MLGRNILTTLFIFLELVSIISSQSCIRNEVRAALEEIGNQSPRGFIQSTQSADTANADLQQLNNTMQQGFLSISEELQELRQLLSTILSLHYDPGSSPTNPALSCKEIFDRNTSSPSGYYWLQSRSERVILAYCDMERTCGGVHGGWMKVTSIDMTNSTHSCPSGLRTLTSPKRLCAMNINGGGCSSSHLDVHGVQYSRVCGKIIGYQQKSPDAFWPYTTTTGLKQ